MSKFDGIRVGDTVLVTANDGSTIKFVVSYASRTWLESRGGISLSYDWTVNNKANVEVVERVDISRNMLDEYCKYDKLVMSVAEKMACLVGDVGLTERPLHERMADYYESEELKGLNRNIRMKKIAEKFDL